MDLYKTFYNRCLRFLTIRNRSEKEIRDYLVRLSGKPEAHPESDSGLDIMTVIEQVISKLKANKFINDIEFARLWIQKRTRINPKSLYIIKMELREKGIDEQTISQFLQNQKEEVVDDLTRAKELVDKHIKKYKGLTKQELYQKLGGFLSRRGFSYEVVKKSIDEVLQGTV